ncbi:GNAT family N-acetyltransferase, partial [Kitasatospora sp. NPDC093558]
MSQNATSGLAILDSAAVADRPGAIGEFTAAAHRILAELVAAGAALGWLEPPAPDEVAALVDEVLS